MAKKESQIQKRRAAVDRQKRQKTRQLQMVGAVLLLLVGAFAVFSLTNQQDSHPNTLGEEVSSQIGGTAPDFQLVTNKGERLALSDYRGQPVAVMFMHTW